MSHVVMPSDQRLKPLAFIPSKFAIPPRPPEFVSRLRLVEFLHNHTDRKLILISAAAGYGKSALLADFAHDTDFLVVWYRIDESDCDLVTFLINLVTSLSYRFPHFESILPKLTSQTQLKPTELAAVLTNEINQQITEPFFWLLDDFHFIGEVKPILRFFDALLANLPLQVHFILAGRTIPSLRFSTLAARQQIAGLSEEQLRFTPEEARTLLEVQNQQTFSSLEAQDIVTNTEGWITGILLTSHLMKQGTVGRLMQARSPDSPLYDFLAEEVFEQLPEPFRQFLMESAVLPEMEPPACNEILERSDSDVWLRQADVKRLFINVVGSDFRSYQYHHLFREFLLTQLQKQSPARLRQLQTRVADWFLKQQMPEAAVTFYVKAGELTKASQIVEQQAKTMFQSGRHAILRQWAEQLSTISVATPELNLFLSKAAVDAGELNEGDGFLDKARQGFAEKNDRLGGFRVNLQLSWLLYHRGAYIEMLELLRPLMAEISSVDQPMIVASAFLYTGLGQLALNQLIGAEDSFNRAIQLLASPEARYDLAAAYNNLALVLRTRGKLTQAAQVQQQAIAICRELSATWLLAIALNNVALDFHLLGQYESAWQVYTEVMHVAEKIANIRIKLLGMIGQADLLAEIGSYSQANALYQLALKQSEQAEIKAFSAYLYGAIARVERWSGHLINALEWLRRGHVLAKNGVQIEVETSLERQRAMTLIDLGYVAEGAQVIEKVCVDLENAQAQTDLAQALSIRAYAEWKQGHLLQAQHSVSRALEVATQLGTDQMLVSEVRTIRGVWEYFRDLPQKRQQIDSLFQRADNLSAFQERLKLSDIPDAGASLGDHSTIGPNLQVRAFGQSRVAKSGKVITAAEWEAQRTRELFFYLVDQCPAPREKILSTFWPDKTLARATANLNQTLYRLRRAIDQELILSDGTTYRLLPQLELDYDVSRFEQAASSALSRPPGDLQRLDFLVRAINLYTGEYLNDLAVEWAEKRRNDLHNLYIRALIAYADALIDLLRYGEARAILNKAIAAEPYREDVHVRMMRCLGYMGRRHELVEHYRNYRELLRNDLGLEPSSEMVNSYATLIQ